jgi:DNA-binding CsgD family transcriptional regulator
LSEQTVLRLEEWRRRTGNGSIAAVIDEAIDLYGRVRRPDEIAAYARLSPRLREVLRLIAEGHSTKGIAFALKVSPKTVEFHRGRLMRILDIHGVAGLVRYAIRVGAALP